MVMDCYARPQSLSPRLVAFLLHLGQLPFDQVRRGNGSPASTAWATRTVSARILVPLASYELPGSQMVLATISRSWNSCMASYYGSDALIASNLGPYKSGRGDRTRTGCGYGHQAWEIDAQASASSPGPEVPGVRAHTVPR